jgi:hypothetical protein
MKAEERKDRAWKGPAPEGKKEVAEWQNGGVRK